VAHPSFPNPTIQEALCEIHFEGAPSASWSPTRPGALAEALKADFPEFETLTEQGFNVAVGPEGSIVPTPLPTRIRLKFSRKSDPTLLQMSQDVFTVNVLPPYRGWPKLKSELVRLWPMVSAVTGPTLIKRVGLRYINRIPRESQGELPSAWLKQSEFLAPAILNSQPDFLMRLESKRTANDQCLITVTIDRSMPGEKFGALLFDVDRIHHEVRKADDAKLPDLLESLHQDVWDVFESSKNKRYDALLNGEKRESAA
jgi:uncharacterized protein (TIGR04255 family)